MNIKYIYTTYSKGLFIGFGMLIPGISGGTAAMISGVFEDIINATSNIIKHPIKSLKVLLPIALGTLSSILVLSSIINTLCSNFPTLMHRCFCFLTLFSAILFVKKNIDLNYNKSKFFSAVIGIIFAFSIFVFLNNYNYDATKITSFAYFLFGFPLSVALILPGISFSYMLLVFNIYEEILLSIQTLKISVLFPLLLGIFAGTVIFSKLLNNILKKHKQETYCFIMGFVFVSVIDMLVSGSIGA